MVLILTFLAMFFMTGQYLREYFRGGMSGGGEAIGGRTQGPVASQLCTGEDCEVFTQENDSTMMAPPETPYETNPIYSVDDYEYNLVFGNEGNREIGRKAISNAMFRYPLDWSVQPPSSAVFQKGLEAFENQQRADADPNKKPMDLSMFDSISGQAMVPPNMDVIDADEKKLLATYSPEPLNGEEKECKKETPFEKVRGLVKKIYDKRGEVAIIEPSKQGQNVWEITEVYKKDEPVVWEDEVPEPERQEMRGEQTIQVPKTVNELSANLDPFFEPRPTTRMSKNDYTKWTPGLERMFAPTYPKMDWY